MKTRIKELRTAKNITQTALAIAIGCSQNVISKIELEYIVPNADILCGIADYFHTSVDYLLYRTDQRYGPGSHISLPNSKIDEYAAKLQFIPPKEMDAIFTLIDRLIDD